MTTKADDTHNPTPATEPLALKSNEIDKLPGTRADVIEEAICKRHKLKPPPAITDK